jgi:DnaJ-class molecular chaperone with C-terminal Zn finger domain
MINYYDILEVHYEVSTDELKRSFRTLIKKYHPDIHGQNKLWAESKTKTIIQAYKTLSNSTSREHYDKRYKHLLYTYSKHKPREKTETTAATGAVQEHVRTIFTDLLNGHIHHAIKNHERLLKDYAGVDFFSSLNKRDSIDCLFLLAEAYEKLDKFDMAISLYEFILEKGKGNTHRSHLLHEVKERIRNIYCRHLARRAAPEKALGYYEKVLRLKLYKNEIAFIHKKIAECYLTLKAYENALRHLNIALSLKPNLQGAHKLKTKLKQHIPDFAL